MAHRWCRGHRPPAHASPGGHFIRQRFPENYTILPVPSTKFGVLVNGKTAKALGLTVPQSILIRADQVIQRPAEARR